MDDPFYLFMHIPRLRERRSEALWMNNIASECVTYYNQNSTQLLDNLEMTLQAGFHDYRALIGHFQYGVHLPLTWPSKYVTFLRDPVERAASSYYENVKIMSPAVLDGDGKLMSLTDCLREREQFFCQPADKDDDWQRKHGNFLTHMIWSELRTISRKILYSLALPNILMPVSSCSRGLFVGILAPTASLILEQGKKRLEGGDLLYFAAVSTTLKTSFMKMHGIISLLKCAPQAVNSMRLWQGISSLQKPLKMVNMLHTPCPIIIQQ